MYFYLFNYVLGAQKIWQDMGNAKGIDLGRDSRSFAACRSARKACMPQPLVDTTMTYSCRILLAALQAAKFLLSLPRALPWAVALPALRAEEKV